MSQWWQVSRIALCMAKVKVTDWVSQWVSEWQGHLLSCSGQLKMKMKFQYELRGSLYERAVFVKLLSSSDKKYMKLQTTNKFDIQKGKTEKKTQIWTESGPHVCVTIDHFRQLRAHPPPDFRDWLCVPTRCVYPRTTRKRRRNESKQKSRDIPAICPRIFTGYSSLENDWSLCEDDSFNYVKVISHKPLYLQTLKTGSSALSGFEAPCCETYKCHTMPALYFTFISAIGCSDV